MKNKNGTIRSVQTIIGLLIVIAAAPIFPAFASPDLSIKVSLSRSRAQRGDTVEIKVQTFKGGTPARDPVHAVLLTPTVGAQTLSLKPVATKPGLYRGEAVLRGDAPEGMYVVHVWMGEISSPTAVGKASFLLGRLINDFFIAAYVDKDKPAQDIDSYLRDFRSIGGNFLIAHNLISPTKAFYPSKICKTDVTPGSEGDLVELILNRADKQGLSVLLSVSWDMTKQSPFKDRMTEIKAIARELYDRYKHHPSLAGFYSYQEGSGTYFVPYVREFCQYIKSLGPNLLTACAPHVDDPLLAGYLSTIQELDIIIYQAGVMASYRTDNRKKYPPRRVKDFCGLGAGAKRLQDKIAINHVELFGYLENRLNPQTSATTYENIYRQMLSAAMVTDADGISFFSYHAHVYEAGKTQPPVERSRAAISEGLKAFDLITSQISRERNQLVVYFPYSDWIIERWPNYFLPALDAFRVVGVPIEVLPYAPPLEESVYPYYPFHMNRDVLSRLLKERTVLVLPNISGFQQTDSDLIKSFVEQGGVIVAFGPQIPMGRSYERDELFGVEEGSDTATHTQVTVRDQIGVRVKPGSRFALTRLQLPSWTTKKGRPVASFEDGSPAITIN
ncbi:MAG TPA: alpha-amylase family protein, partial [Pyrinomonadaceae bacterium]